ncbi:MAG: hypothetical protein Q7W54_09320 [Bacteroidota bacterium]|nr:hypothetical protein [Bacteroidota bacterium]
MEFTNGQIYHVFNRGNNSQRIFFNRGNYLFFLDKIRNNILPHADILAWCLIPNHFHLMISVNQVEVEFCEQVNSGESEGFTSSETLTRVTPSKTRSLNDSIGIILRSYTRAVQKQQKTTGSLFQKETKAICLTEPEFAPAYFDTHFGMMGNLDLPETNYLNVCFDYIHLNPVSDRLVRNPEDWEFSSYRDYHCGRKGKLVNRELARELGLIT